MKFLENLVFIHVELHTSHLSEVPVNLASNEMLKDFMYKRCCDRPLTER